MFFIVAFSHNTMYMRPNVHQLIKYIIYHNQVMTYYAFNKLINRQIELFLQKFFSTFNTFKMKIYLKTSH
jgi:hypothetical protein